MKKLTKLEKQIAVIENRRNELFALKKPIDEELISSYEELSQLKEQRDKILAKNKTDDWEWLLREDLDSTSIKHKILENKLEEIGLSSFGYNTNTLQRMINIKLTKGDPASFAQTLEGLQLILPFIKAEDDGFKYIKIFEYTLSQYASWVLAVSDKEFNIIRTRYVHAKHNSLEDAVKYIQENHWYKNILNDSENEDSY